MAVYVRKDLRASVVVGPSDDDSESVCVCLGASPRAPRFLVCYRAPKAAAAPLFRVIQHHADECGAIGAPLVIGGDLNLPTLQLAQSGVDRRALALWLGNGGRDLPKELALELPLIFAETFGVWARRVPRSHVERIFGL